MQLNLVLSDTFNGKVFYCKLQIKIQFHLKQQKALYTLIVYRPADEAKISSMSIPLIYYP